MIAQLPPRPQRLPSQPFLRLQRFVIPDIESYAIGMSMTVVATPFFVTYLPIVVSTSLATKVSSEVVIDSISTVSMIPQVCHPCCCCHSDHRLIVPFSWLPRKLNMQSFYARRAFCHRRRHHCFYGDLSCRYYYIVPITAPPSAYVDNFCPVKSTNTATGASVDVRML